jgi:hypothetical protein
MNTAPSRALFDGIFRGKAPGLSEFGALLQFIDSPAVLVLTLFTTGIVGKTDRCVIQ